MRIGMLGSGMVGTTLASKLVSLGHEVKLGSRTANNDKGAAWAKGAGRGASHGTFAEAAAFGEMVWNATAGGASLEALAMAGAANLEGKVLVDVANALDFSKGMPPSLLVANTDSLGESIQRAYPKAKVVKAFNTVNVSVMVAPESLGGGEHDLLVCGNDAEAKARVADIARSFGWKRVIDVGDITAARGTEAWLLLWIRLMGALGTASFNLHLVR